MATGIVPIDDTGWINATLTSNFTEWYDGQPVIYRRIGNLVNIMGNVKSTSTLKIDNDTMHTIFTLPEGFRPQHRVNAMLQGLGGTQYWWLLILPTGAVNVLRLRVGSTYYDLTTSIRLLINIVFSV